MCRKLSQKSKTIKSNTHCNHLMDLHLRLGNAPLNHMLIANQHKCLSLSLLYLVFAFLLQLKSSFGDGDEPRFYYLMVS